MINDKTTDRVECDCIEFCSRWSLNDDGSGGCFVPYNPFSLAACRHIIYENMKPKIRKIESQNNA